MAKFKPGQSGNPAGRPKGSVELQTLARQHTEDAIRVVLAAMKVKNPRVRLMAALAILDRGWGKPMQAVQHVDEQGRTVMGNWVIVDKDQLARLPDPNIPGAQPNPDSLSVVIIPSKDRIDPETGEVEGGQSETTH